MLKGKEFLLVILVLTLVLSFNLSEVFAQPGCTFSTTTGNVQYGSDWCQEVISGAAEMVRADAIWEGAVEPASQGSSVTLEWVGQDSVDSTIELVDSGATVLVTLGSDACGAFRVKVTTKCQAPIYGPWVRITDAGAWHLCGQTTSAGCSFNATHEVISGTKMCKYACGFTGASLQCDGLFPCIWQCPSGDLNHCHDIDCLVECPPYTNMCYAASFEWGCP